MSPGQRRSRADAQLLEAIVAFRAGQPTRAAAALCRASAVIEDGASHALARSGLEIARALGAIEAVAVLTAIVLRRCP